MSVGVSARILFGDVLAGLAHLGSRKVQCVVTSPPYWGLRDYGVEGQLGLERSPELYVAGMVEVFRGVRRVLRDDGTLWLNIGDSYAGSGKGGNPDPGSSKQATNVGSQTIGTLYGKTGESARRAAVTNVSRQFTAAHPTIKAKDLVGIPWLLAFALRADGWYLRSEIIWHKPNPMPESVIDRPTKAHETLFLLTKSAKYYYDADAIAEPAVCGSNGSNFDDPRDLAVRPTTSRKHRTSRKRGEFNGKSEALVGREAFRAITETRNKRSVWTIAPKPFKGAHFATFPPALVEPCVFAGSAEGDTILDPFGGSMTTGVVALQHNRSFVGLELNPDYVKIGYRRIFSETGIKADIQHLDGVE